MTDHNLAVNSLLAIVKAELGISDGTQDAYLKRQINSYISALESLTGRDFGKQVGYKTLVRVPAGQKRLILTKLTPITSITSIKLDGVVVPPDNYEIENADLGFIRNKSTWGSTGWSQGGTINRYEHETEFLYEVTYSGGEDWPAEVESAIIDAVIGSYSTRGISSSVKSIKVGDASTSFGTSTSTGFPPAFDSILNRYKVIGAL